MVDMVLSLKRQEHRGPIIALSRRGLRPNPHRFSGAVGQWLPPCDAPTTVLALWQIIRRRARQAEEQGVDWRAVIDGLRPITQELWARLNEQERCRFLRHAAVYWDVHRHRIAPTVHHQLQEMEHSGQFRVIAGRVISQDANGHQLKLTIRPRGKSEERQITVDRLVRCTGIPLEYSRSESGLLAALQSRSLIKTDALGLGALSTPRAQAVNAKGTITEGLYLIGSARKCTLWESVAVPELRQQAYDLAGEVLASLPRFLHGLSPHTASKTQVPTERSREIIFRQLFDHETHSYTYLIADPGSRHAVVVDPVFEQVERDIQVLKDLELDLQYCLETHLHADRITGAGQLRRRTGCRLIAPDAAGINGADQTLRGGEMLQLGSLEIEVIATPGHTAEHLAYCVEQQHLLSGDALLIRGCGRTDFQNGDAGQLFDSLQRLLSLPPETLVWPCHDYQGHSHSTIGEEQRLNPRISGRSRESFIALMQSLSLEPPKRLHDAVPANLHLGDLVPTNTHTEEFKCTQQAIAQIRNMEEANREVYNQFIGMFI